MKYISILFVLLLVVMSGCDSDSINRGLEGGDRNAILSYYGKLSISKCYDASRFYFSDNALCSSDMISEKNNYYNLTMSRLIVGKYDIVSPGKAIDDSHPELLNASMVYMVNGTKKYQAQSGTVEILHVSDTDNKVQMRIDVVLSPVGKASSDIIEICMETGCLCYRTDDKQQLNPIDCPKQVGDREIHYRMELTAQYCSALDEALGVDIQHCPF